MGPFTGKFQRQNVRAAIHRYVLTGYCFFNYRRIILTMFIDIPIFLALYFGYKIVKRTKIVNLKEMDLWSGKEAIDRQEHLWPVRKPRNFAERIWFWIA